MIKLLFIATVAHAGWFKRLCELRFIPQSPYEFELSSDEWIDHQLDRYHLKMKWRDLESDELEQYDLLVIEKRKRDAIKRIIEAGKAPVTRSKNESR